MSRPSLYHEIFCALDATVCIIVESILHHFNFINTVFVFLSKGKALGLVLYLSGDYAKEVYTFKSPNPHVIFKFQN